MRLFNLLLLQLNSLEERLAIQTGEWFEALRINDVDDIEAHLEAIKLIKDMDDVGNVKRGKFTWYKADGSANSCLDRFLISDGLLISWKLEAQEVGIRGKFTWYKADGSAKSRLDRFLISDGLLVSWKLEAQEAGIRKSIWEANVIVGKRAFVLKDKLKILKAQLRNEEACMQFMEEHMLASYSILTAMQRWENDPRKKSRCSASIGGDQRGCLE
ncbi:hypothetical protein KIW84_034470 [Lathyrus oleraceus]|uniref:Uncharacterized protein n=1 Tax=Pisum sativum TaxID=3888 RepID=A0A9D5B177_PEA|nr:hypothetical protein KIW84_034470 [Pisum sativum]